MSRAAVAFAVSVGAWAVWVYVERDVMWQALDLSVYHGAARSLADGHDDLYGTTFGAWSLPFVYPPFAALVVASVPLAFDGLRWVVSVASVLSLVAVGWSAWSLCGRTDRRELAGLALATAAACLWLEPVAWTLVWGQVNLVLLAVLLADLARPDDRRTKGIGIGLAAGFKLIPLAFVGYLLATRRYRAAGVAGATFAATAAVGWVVAPSSSRRYWSDLGAIPDRVSQEVSIATLNNQSLLGLFNRLSADGTVVTALWLVSAAVVVGLGLRACRAASERGDELLAIVLVGGVTLFLSPISWSHHWVWVVPALVLLVDRGRHRLAALAALAYAAWPLSLGTDGRWDADVALQPFGLIWLAPRGGQRERHWTPLEALVGNGYLLIGLAAAGIAAWYLVVEPRRSRFRARNAA